MGAIAVTAFVLGPGADPGTPAEAADAPGATGGATTPEGPPTPYFASYRSLRLALPVPPESVSLLAFHQASGDRALHLESLVPDTDMTALAARVQDGDYPTSAQLAEESGPYPNDGYVATVWAGEALRLWRSNRSGPPDTAVDVGAEPGSEVRAPVSGTVIAVRSYLLYGRWEDYEIHIRPEGWPEVDVVLIHIADPQVAEGDWVVAGVTPIAAVRYLSDKVDLQLEGYTRDGGDHTHMQLNEMPDPATVEFLGGS